MRWLSQPSAYPHPAQTVERRETHVSHVFLAGAFAYKLKKPVKFPFLDASTLALRQRFCRLELSLNRRLAPAVYLAMVPVVETPRGLRLGGRGKVVEWLVKMRRLPEERMLDQVVARRQVSRRDMRRIARRLVPFFRRAARSRRIARFGEPAQVKALVLGNLQECQPFLGTLLKEGDRRFVEQAYRQFLALNEPLLARRVRERRIIDGHGDLRCENICLPAAPKWRSRGAAQAGMTDVAIFDCVEFQPAFRCGDIVNDLAFLLMDLEFRGRQDLAHALQEACRGPLHDPDLERLLPFYQCHRTLVRGKVRGFAWLQHPRTAQGRRIRGLSRRHFRLAVEYAKQFSRPRLIVVGGLIGSGKSTLARGLSEALGAAWLRTDEIRLTEFAKRRRSGQGFAEGIYAPRVSAQVYDRMIRRAERLVRQGESVVCDGTFSKAQGREALRRIAKRHGAGFHFFECVIPKAVALRRVAKRYAAGTDISEARPEHYGRLKADFEPVRGRSTTEWTRISDNRASSATLHEALRILRRLTYNEAPG